MKILITGGCGFIGCNAAVRFARLGHKVTVFDDLSRPSSAINLEWLRGLIPFDFLRGDIRDKAVIPKVIKEGKFDLVLHLAAQVAVTTSVKDPSTDFGINAWGTFNLLEAIRLESPDAVFIYSSTNKVYGKLDNVAVGEMQTRYVMSDKPEGILETQPLDFHSPYGCSKGAADQYTIDYARIYNLRTATFRQSCIYGTRQFGVEDQGWVAWFTLAHQFGRPITLFGTGKQVRDLLFVDDLIDAYLAAANRVEAGTGEAFNIGGGITNAISIIEFFELLQKITGRQVIYDTADWRPGDQPVFVSDNSKVNKLLGWQPTVSVVDGLQRLLDWVNVNQKIIQSLSSKL